MNDFSGHPFQVELSRSLAARGHDVLHTYSTQYVSGHGFLETGDCDPTSLRIEGLTAMTPMVKYDPVGRARFDISYAAAWQRRLAQEPWDVVVACNVPLFSLARMRPWLRRHDQRWVLWHQDVYSVAIAEEAQRRLPAAAAALARRAVIDQEQRVVRDADAVVAISGAFAEQYRRWGVHTDHVDVIANWAPIGDIRPTARENAWSKALPDSDFRLLYAGTLGRKHNPDLLIQLADGLTAQGVDPQLVVISEGVGIEHLRETSGHRPDVELLPFQPAEDLPLALGAADVLIALLEPGASAFSVPSKVASYLAAGRPVLLLAPEDNPASGAVRAAGGFVARPDADGLAAAVRWLAELSADVVRRERVGRRSRAFAEDSYDIARITDRFEAVLDHARFAGHARSSNVLSA